VRRFFRLGLLAALLGALLLGPGPLAGTVAATVPRAGAATDSAFLQQLRQAAGPLHVGGSVQQVYVTGATPGARLELVDRRNRSVASARADQLGGHIFRGVAPGGGYRVKVGTKFPAAAVDVTSAQTTPPSSLYTSQKLTDGYQYLRTRDGTLLSIDVQLPGPIDQGPYPTVVEYSGYDPSNPNGNQPASRLAQTLGYATVGVNMRGTGCSGGAWQYFETLQSLDGYDAIETVAAQPWVAFGKVGMVGISYPGISQLFVAQTEPPHLAAITPLSVIDDTYRGVMYPGGIFNNGFALEWAKERQSDARPAGQGWARRRIDDGDKTCAANQALRLQTPSVLTEIRSYRYYDPATLDPLAPYTFVDRIRVPTFVAGAWQDEQTGGHFPDMLANFPTDVPHKFTLTNGTHFDSIGPDVITRWAEFLDFYVAHRIPHINAVSRVSATFVYSRIVGVSGLQLPPDRFDGYTDFGAALAAYEAEPPVRVLFDNGAGAQPGAPVPGFEEDFSSWPVPGVTPTAFYTGSSGALTATKPTGADSAATVDRYRYDPASVPRTDHPTDVDDFFKAHPSYDWKPLPNGDALAWVTPPLTSNVVALGPGSVDLWLQSSAPDTDLEVTVTEVRPDGKETYVQSGWLRASRRKLDPRTSTDLEPRPTYTRADAAPLPSGRFSLVRVELFPFGHVFRAGSRIRLAVQAPGGNRPLWEFESLPARGRVVNQIARSAVHPSRVVLPVVPGIAVPTALPACGALRGQPCRDYAVPKPLG
jgi:uncharacterized protein